VRERERETFKIFDISPFRDRVREKGREREWEQREREKRREESGRERDRERFVKFTFYQLPLTN